jgi:hypothetical protein
MQAALILRAAYAAAPLAVLAAAFAAATGAESRELGTVLALEQLAIQSFWFLFPLAILARTPPGLRLLALLGVALLSGLYGVYSHRIAGATGVLAFAGLTLATYAGALLNRDPRGALQRLAARWLCNTLLFWLALRAAGAGDADEALAAGGQAALAAGAWYFGLSALLEASGVFHARAWARVGAGTGPLLGAFFFCAAPIVIAALYAGVLEATYEAPGADWRRSWIEHRWMMRDWVPPVVTAILLSWRLLQWHWIATALREPGWRWWRSAAFLGTAALLAAAYAGCGAWLSAEGWRETSQLIAYGALAKFVLPELLVLLAFAPGSWIASARALRTPPA